MEGTDKREFSEAAGLPELAVRLGTVGARRLDLGATTNALEHLDSEEPLRLLEVHESGTTGMYGTWETADSKMYLALLSMAFHAGVAGTGGSFGYGKAGLIRGSLPRVVFAYSCWPTRLAEKKDGGVTRRFLGMTYWGHHTIDEVKFTGFARYGVGTSNDRSADPFVDADADVAAQRLGLAVRNHADPSDWGTTFLLVDTPIQPQDLRDAVERWWWPALEDHSQDFSVEILSEDGSCLPPRARKHAILKHFFEAYEIARSGRKAEGIHQRSVTLGKVEHHDVGRLALVADPDGWSFPREEDADEDHKTDRSMVALMRKPRMVVEYAVPMTRAGAPYIRGVFVGDDTVNEWLRETENKTHDKWQDNASDAQPRYRKLVKKIHKSIHDHVSSFRKTLIPPPPPAPRIRRLHLWDQMMRKVFPSRGSQPGPKPAKRPLTCTLSHRLIAKEAYGDRVHCEGRATIGLSGNFHGREPAQIEVIVQYKASDEDSPELLPIEEVTAPKGFVGGPDKSEQTADRGRPKAWRFRGEIARDSAAEFAFRTSSHPVEWTGVVIVLFRLIEGN